MSLANHLFESDLQDSSKEHSRAQEKMPKVFIVSMNSTLCGRLNHLSETLIQAREPSADIMAEKYVLVQSQG